MCLFGGPLGLEFGLLGVGLGLGSYGLRALALYLLMHTCMHACIPSFLDFFDWLGMPSVHVFMLSMLAIMSIHTLLNKSLALCTRRFKLKTIPFFPSKPSLFEKGYSLNNLGHYLKIINNIIKA